MRLIALISGRGSNLLAVLDAIRSGQLAAEMVAVISNNPDAAGLARAQDAGIPTHVIDHRDYADRLPFDLALSQQIDDYHPDLIILAGFMRILGEDFVNQYHGRLINIHPSLLPAYRGLHTHARVLAAGEHQHGASVHFVTPELDGGPVIARATVQVLPDDDAERLAARVLAEEHRLYPTVMGWFAAGRVRLQQHQVWLDHQPLSQPVELNALEQPLSCDL